VQAYDPQATENAKAIFTDVVYCADAYATAEGADVLVLATEWNEFRALNFERIKKALRQPIVVDLRNVYDAHRMSALGFRYTSVGRVDDRRKRPR
jgi:UDPglucose 6-dehydrogenase